MLTADLVSARIRKGVVKPAYVDPNDTGLLDTASALIELYRLHIGHPHGELRDNLKSLTGVGPDALMARGLAKLLEDRCEFEIDSPLDPKMVRMKLFEAAAQHHPLAKHEDERRTARSTVLTSVATELETSPTQLEASLYADLPSARILRDVQLPSSEWLLSRYNVALAQAVLLRASSVSIRLTGNSSARFRQLFRFIKFFRLMHQIQTLPSGGYLIELDGPLSLFKLSQKYGLQLAEMVPALLLCQGWTLEAQVQWGRQRKPQQFRLSPDDRLRSHYPDKGVYESREETWFKERWTQLESSWSLDQQPVVLHIGGQDVVFPDFTLRNPDGRIAYLEIIGFWRRSYLERRIELYREHGPGNLILAIARQLQGSLEGLEGFEGEIYTFREVIAPAEIRARAEKVGKKD